MKTVKTIKEAEVAYEAYDMACEAADKAHEIVCEAYKAYEACEATYEAAYEAVCKAYSQLPGPKGPGLKKPHVDPVDDE